VFAKNEWFVFCVIRFIAYCLLQLEWFGFGGKWGKMGRFRQNDWFGFGGKWGKMGRFRQNEWPII
jgi:hypothetical protein